MLSTDHRRWLYWEQRHPVMTEIRMKMEFAGAPQEAIDSFTQHGNIPWMWWKCEMAREAAANKKLSYRGFYVGAGMQFYIPGKPEPRVTTTFGHNSKDWDNRVHKLCAERRALDQAKGFYADTYITGLLTIGPLREEDEGPTLPPCKSCQEVIGYSRFIRPWTGVLTIREGQFLNLDAITEFQTWAELREKPAF